WRSIRSGQAGTAQRAAPRSSVGRSTSTMCRLTRNIPSGRRTSKHSEPFSPSPMLQGDELLGVILTYRLEVRPFTDKQIALVETFADQAVIAIENVRLFDEVQARTEELSESLRQQTATAEVLKTISRTAFDLQRVFNTLVENAVRLCEAERAFLFRFDGEFLRSVASYNVLPELRE